MLPACKSQANPTGIPKAWDSFKPSLPPKGSSFSPSSTPHPLGAKTLLPSPHRHQTRQSPVPCSRDGGHMQPPAVAVLSGHHAPLLLRATAVSLAASSFSLGESSLQRFVFLGEVEKRMKP